MKKIVVALLMFLYLIPAIGVSVSAHYCMGTVTSVSLELFNDGHHCPCGSKAMKKDCCRDESTIIKLKSEQQKSQQVSSTIIKVTDFQPAFTAIFTIGYPLPSLISEFTNTTQPPDNVKHPLYIRHHVFRI